MSFTFDGSSLRLARIFNDFALEEVAEKVGKTRQYLHKLETGQSSPTPELSESLAHALYVLPNFFSKKEYRLNEDQFHFRKLFTTKNSIKQVAIARGEMMHLLIKELEKELKFPPVNIPSFQNIVRNDDIEKAAEECRKHWGLGLAPIHNMTRLAENIGAIVTNFNIVSKEVDALSVSVDRPFIVRNTAKESVCRQRFDIAHEIGHLVMHEGVVTGDRTTENQANRFASALLLPRPMMLKLYPRPNGNRLDWKGMREFKLNWKVSKAAILYRAKQLDLITESQYKTGVITLRKYGETQGEKEDHLIAPEQPELLEKSLRVLLEKKNLGFAEVAKKLNVQPAFIQEVTGLAFPLFSRERHLSLVK